MPETMNGRDRVTQFIRTGNIYECRKDELYILKLAVCPLDLIINALGFIALASSRSISKLFAALARVAA